MSHYGGRGWRPGQNFTKAIARSSDAEGTRGPSPSGAITMASRSIFVSSMCCPTCPRHHRQGPTSPTNSILPAREWQTPIAVFIGQSSALFCWGTEAGGCMQVLRIFPYFLRPSCTVLYCRLLQQPIFRCPVLLTTQRDSDPPTLILHPRHH